MVNPIYIILCVLFSKVGTGQNTFNPVVSQTNTVWKITSVIIGTSTTKVVIQAMRTGTNYSTDSWVSISNNTYLSDFYNNKKIYRILDLGDNQLDTRYSTAGTKGQTFTLELNFPKLSPGIEKINIMEIATGGGNPFEWRGVLINNPDYSVKTGWTESTIKEQWHLTTPETNEGIYESTNTDGNSSKLRVAVKKTGTGYDVIYLDGANSEQSAKWEEGDLKASLSETATDNLMNVSWIMQDKTENKNLYITFEQGLMNMIWTNGSPKSIFLKLYPTSLTPEAKKEGTSSGTGFALSSNGLVVTNYHVVDRAKKLIIKGVNGDFSLSYKAKVLVSDKNNDLAIIQIDDNSFTSTSKIPYGIKSAISDVGENVFVLGYPLRANMGDEIKLTNGIISSKSGFQGDITSYQISVPLQPGNSGGPLFDKAGNLIGVVNAKLTIAENVSYAIKINYLRNLIDLLPSTPINTINTISNLSLSEQVKLLSKIVYIIEAN